MSLESVKTKVRNLIMDVSSSITDTYVYSTSSIFSLSEENPISISDVSINDVSTSNYTYSSTTKKVTITASLTSGDSIKIQYTYYSKYSETEIESYIKSALTHISISNYAHWKVVSSEIYPEPSHVQDNLIAMVASILAEPDNKSYSLPDIRVTVPKSLPIRDLINKTINVFKRSGGHGVFFVS